MNSIQSSAIIIGAESGDHLRLELLEVVPDDLEGAGDFRISVKVSCGGFSGSACGCWILRGEFDDFVAGFHQFEMTRIGQCTLESMHREFALTISSKSPQNWPTVTGTVAGSFLAGHQRTHLDFVFILDSSRVIQVTEGFELFLPK